MPNRYEDQDYPRYYDRNDRYDSQSERGSSQQNRRGDEQRNRSGSGRENTQGGSSDYNRDRESGYYGMSHNRDEGRNQGFAGTGYQGGYFGSDFGRGYSAQDRDNDDFASSSRPGGSLTGDFGRNTGSDRGDYTLYGYDRDTNYASREGDYGGYGERTEDYRNQNQNYGSPSSGGSYARSNERSQQDREHGGSSRYYGNQSGSSSYGQQRDDASERYRRQQREGQSFYGQGGSYSGSSEQGFDYNRSENRSDVNRDRSRNEQDDRGWWDKTSDEVASWFGDGEAARRRERDSRENDYSRYQSGSQQNTSSHRGKGPKNYRRSDERIKDDINDRLTDYAYLDASEIDVEVNGGEVVLTGTVESRYAKRMAEDIAENISGVNHVENRIRVKQQNQSSSQTNFASTNTSGSTGTYGSRDDLRENYTNQGLTGSQTGATGSSLTDTTSNTAGTNAGTSSSTTGATTGSNPGALSAAASTGTSGTTGSSTTGTTDTTTGSTGTSGTSGTATSSTSGGRDRNKNE